MSKLNEPGSTKFESPYQKLCLNIIRTNNWLLGKMQEVFKSKGLTLQQYNILKIMSQLHPKPSNIQLLKTRMIDRQSDVSRLVTRLNSKQLVKRSVSQEDRRKSDIFVTGKGFQKLSEVEKELQAFQIFLPNLEDQEIDHTNHLLDKLCGTPIEQD